MSVKKFSSAIAILGLMLFMVACANNVRAQSFPLDSMWVSPQAINYSTNNASVGTLFNVTVWANMENGSYVWQVKLAFNSSVFQAVNAVYSAGSTSAYFAGHTTIPIAPIIDNVGGSVLIGESLISTDYVTQENASLMITEFNITSMPTTTTPLTGLFDINSTGVADTFVQDYNLNTIVTDSNLYSATYTLTYVAITHTAPTIGNATQVPATNVTDSDSVIVSAPVTDNSGTGIKNVTLVYSTDSFATNHTTAMTLNATSGLYDGTIPEYAKGTQVWYDTQAYDNNGDFTEKSGVNLTPYTYTVVPEFTFVALLVIMIAMLAAAVLMVRKKHSR